MKNYDDCIYLLRWLHKNTYYIILFQYKNHKKEMVELYLFCVEILCTKLWQIFNICASHRWKIHIYLWCYNFQYNCCKLEKIVYEWQSSIDYYSFFPHRIPFHRKGVATPPFSWNEPIYIRNSFFWHFLLITMFEIDNNEKNSDECTTDITIEKKNM